MNNASWMKFGEFVLKKFDIQEKVATNKDSKIWIQNHRLKMTRALAKRVTPDRIKKTLFQGM